MPSWIASTVAEIAEMITPGETDGSSSALQILGNLDKPLIEQLPQGKVDSMRLSAPFLDPASAAVGKLIDRFSPAELVIGLQPTLASYSGSSLVDAAGSRVSVEFRDLSEADGRLSHGKLVEWVRGGKIAAMVGSPNLSYAALLASTKQGGNCELAAVSPVEQSLLPEGMDVALETIRSRSTIPSETSPRRLAPLTLLGARHEGDSIAVELIVGTVASIVIETSPDGSPGTWQRCHLIRPERLNSRDVLVSRFRAPEGIGAAVRAVTEGSDEPFITAVVFLTDTARCSARQVDSTAPRLRHEFREVFSDERLLSRFEADLLRLLAENAAYRNREPSSRPISRQSEQASGNDRWTMWLQGAEATIGQNLAASLFPSGLVTTAPPSVRLQQWDVDLGGAIEDIAEDEDPEIVDLTDDGEGSQGTPSPVVPASMYDQMRRFAVKLSQKSIASPRPGLELRMLVVKVLFDLLAGGVWGPTDETWRQPLAEAIMALPPGEEESLPDRALDFLGSLAAVGLALLSHDASMYGGRAEDLILRRAWQVAHPFAAAAESEISKQYIYQPVQGYSRVAGIAGVENIIELAKDVLVDPKAEVRTALEEKGWDAEFSDGAWLVSANRGAPRTIAGRVATLIGESQTSCAVLVQTNSGRCALLQHGQVVALAENRYWKVDRLRSILSTPSSMLTDGPLRTPASPLSAPEPDVVQLAVDVGVSLALIQTFLQEAGK
jgi:hypothetical protein